MVVKSGGAWTNPETGEVEPKLHIHHRFRYRRAARATTKSSSRRAGSRPSSSAVTGQTCSLVHPIRWPGSLHRKGVPKLCQIVELNPGVDIELDNALEILQQGEPGATPHAGRRSRAREARESLLRSRTSIPSKTWAQGPNVQSFRRSRSPQSRTVAPGCGEVHDTGGIDQSEPLWRDSLRVSMFLIDGEHLIHEFSNKYPGYNFDATEAKYDLAYQYKVANDLG